MACRKFEKASTRPAGESTMAIAVNWPEGKWGASVARCPPDRAYVRCLGGSSECNGVIVSTCEWPVTAEPYRAKTAPLPRSSILVRPHRFRPRAERNGGGAGYCPRVRSAYFDSHLSPYPDCSGTLNIGFLFAKKKCPSEEGARCISNWCGRWLDPRLPREVFESRCPIFVASIWQWRPAPSRCLGV